LLKFVFITSLPTGTGKSIIAVEILSLNALIGRATASMEICGTLLTNIAPVTHSLVTVEEYVNDYSNNDMEFLLQCYFRHGDT